jgi:hypothetical protein
MSVAKGDQMGLARFAAASTMSLGLDIIASSFMWISIMV